MVYRHTLITRITHATFGLAFLILALTGAQLYFHAHWLPFKVGTLHQLAGLLMTGSGVLYVGNGIVSGELGKLLFGPRDVAGLMPMIAHYMRLRKEAPEYADYNPLQKLSYTIVLLVLGPLMVATGLGMWRHLWLQQPLSQAFGGRHAVTIWHIGFAIELVLFFIGHIVMVATTGLRNNIRSMITGWYEHRTARAGTPVVAFDDAFEVWVPDEARSGRN